MKKLISSTISALTSAAVLMCSCLCTVFAANEETIYFDPEAAEVCLSDLDGFDLSLTDSPKILSNFREGSYNYGDFLEGNNLAVYNALLELDGPTIEPVIIKLPKTVTIQLSSLPTSPNFSDGDSEIYQNALFSNCKPGIDCALFDRPELYWIEPSGMSITVGSDSTVSRNLLAGVFNVKIRSLKITPGLLTGLKSIEDAEHYGKLLDEALEKVPVTGANRYEILKNIHDYISKFTYYDLDAKFSSSALGALVEPGVVCEGYSEAFKLICDRLDIPCVCVFGNLVEEENAGHMWNYVKMEDGNWYGMDVTWDDLDGAGGNELKYEYFLKGSKSFYKKHTPVSDYKITQLVYPQIPEYDYVLSSSSVTTTTTTTTKTTTTTTTTTTTKAKTTTSTTTTSKPHTTTTSTTTAKPAVTTKVTTTTAITTQPPKPLVGDLNRDGNVNVADLVYCQSALLGKLKPQYSCDANSDGAADVFDVIFMRKLLI